MSNRQNPNYPSGARRPPASGGASGGNFEDKLYVWVTPLTPADFGPPEQTLHEVLSSADSPEGQKTIALAKTGLRAIGDHLTQNPDLCKISVFNDIRNQISDAKTLAEKIDEFRISNPHLTVKSESFSHVTQKDLDNLGIKSITILDGNNFLTKIDNVAHQNLHLRGEKFEIFWNNHGADLGRALGDIQAAASMKPEASARLMIDQFMLRCVRYLRENKKYPLLFPELRVASTKYPVTLLNHSTGYAMFVTGTVDYAMFVSSDSLHGLADDVKAKLQNINDLRELMSFEIDSIPLSVMLKDQRLNLFLVEAKTRNEDSSLKKFIPQAITESLATLEVSKTDAIGWCLTTGTASIFGVISYPQTTNRTRTPLIAHSEILFLDTHHPEKIGFKWSAKNMLATILLWCTSDAGALVKAL